MYDIEDRARVLSPDERRALRQLESRPILDQFRTWLDAHAATALPKLKFDAAVGYARNQWLSLVNYVDDDRLPIDNNDVGRDLRALTIGRKNWLFIGSPHAGPRAATLVASAARHQLDIWAYLRDILEQLAKREHAAAAEITAAARRPTPTLTNEPLAEPAAPAIPESALKKFLPEAWAQSHPEALRHYRTQERQQRQTQQRPQRQARRTQPKPPPGDG